ncbi:unnamed protein product [Gordionus sp. m RMFG-2023]|uniref:uncharacterized protein LOC135928180 n=1 Tax=Gordionus sp. m RMFG-2023 TaxID=3053472 RepID=UPI0030DFBCEA
MSLSFSIIPNHFHMPIPPNITYHRPFNKPYPNIKTLNMKRSIKNSHSVCEQLPIPHSTPGLAGELMNAKYLYKADSGVGSIEKSTIFEYEDIDEKEEISEEKVGLGLENCKDMMEEKHKRLTHTPATVNHFNEHLIEKNFDNNQSILYSIGTVNGAGSKKRKQIAPIRLHHGQGNSKNFKKTNMKSKEPLAEEMDSQLISKSSQSEKEITNCPNTNIMVSHNTNFTLKETKPGPELKSKPSFIANSQSTPVTSSLWDTATFASFDTYLSAANSANVALYGYGAAAPFAFPPFFGTGSSNPYYQYFMPETKDKSSSKLDEPTSSQEFSLGSHLPSQANVLPHPFMMYDMPPFLANSLQQQAPTSQHPLPPPPSRIFNHDAFCELCNKEFCNKYFLKTHKANKHGVFDMASLNNFYTNNLNLFAPQFGLDPSSYEPATTNAAEKIEYNSEKIEVGTNCENRDSEAEFDKSQILYLLETTQSNIVIEPKPPEGFKTPPQITDDAFPNFKDENVVLDISPSIDDHINNDNSNCTKNDSVVIKSSCDNLNDPLNVTQSVIDKVQKSPDISSSKSTSLNVQTFTTHAKSQSTPPFSSSFHLEKQSADLTMPNSSGESYCDLCRKEFCNKYFLKKHKKNIHGIVTPNEPFSNESNNVNKSIKSDSSSQISLSADDTILPSKCEKSSTTHQHPIYDSSLGSTSPNPTLTDEAHNAIMNYQSSNPDKADDTDKCSSNKIIVSGSKYPCTKCDKSFNNMHFLRSHLFNVHDQPIDFGIKNPSIIINHKKVGEENVESLQKSLKTVESNIKTVFNHTDSQRTENSHTNNKLMVTEKPITISYEDDEGSIIKTESCEKAKSLGSEMIKKLENVTRHSISKFDNGSDQSLEFNSLMEYDDDFDTSCSNTMKSKSKIKLISANHSIHSYHKNISSGGFEPPKHIYNRYYNSKDHFYHQWGSSFCQICQKELCNKYFLKTHMVKMHGVSVEEAKRILRKQTYAHGSNSLSNYKMGKSLNQWVSNHSSNKKSSGFYNTKHVDHDRSNTDNTCNNCIKEEPIDVLYKSNWAKSKESAIYQSPPNHESVDKTVKAINNFDDMKYYHPYFQYFYHPTLFPNHMMMPEVASSQSCAMSTTSSLLKTSPRHQLYPKDKNCRMNHVINNTQQPSFHYPNFYGSNIFPPSQCSSQPILMSHKFASPSFKNIGLEPKMIACPYCGLLIEDPKSLLKHLYLEHPDEDVDPSCINSFPYYAPSTCLDQNVPPYNFSNRINHYPSNTKDMAKRLSQFYINQDNYSAYHGSHSAQSHQHLLLSNSYQSDPTIPKHACRKCGRSFNYPETLLRHQKSHLSQDRQHKINKGISVYNDLTDSVKKSEIKAQNRKYISTTRAETLESQPALPNDNADSNIKCRGNRADIFKQRYPMTKYGMDRVYARTNYQNNYHYRNRVKRSMFDKLGSLYRRRKKFRKRWNLRTKFNGSVKSDLSRSNKSSIDYTEMPISLLKNPGYPNNYDSSNKIINSSTMHPNNGDIKISSKLVSTTLSLSYKQTKSASNIDHDMAKLSVTKPSLSLNSLVTSASITNVGVTKSTSPGDLLASNSDNNQVSPINKETKRLPSSFSSPQISRDTIDIKSLFIEPLNNTNSPLSNDSIKDKIIMQPFILKTYNNSDSQNASIFVKNSLGDTTDRLTHNSYSAAETFLINHISRRESISAHVPLIPSLVYLPVISEIKEKTIALFTLEPYQEPRAKKLQ